MLNVFYDDIAGKDHNVLQLNSGRKIEYEKLVLATGSRAIEPPIDGIQRDGVMLINKDPEQIRKIKAEALKAESVVIYGGGYIGVELCDELLRAGKKITIIADTIPCKNAVKLAKDADLLICESTYSSKLEEKGEAYGHMTGKQAGLVANQANAKKLVLTHFSARYKTTEEVEEDAKNVFNNSIAAKDFMVFKV